MLYPPNLLLAHKNPMERRPFALGDNVELGNISHYPPTLDLAIKGGSHIAIANSNCLFSG